MMRARSRGAPGGSSNEKFTTPSWSVVPSNTCSRSEVGKSSTRTGRGSGGRSVVRKSMTPTNGVTASSSIDRRTTRPRMVSPAR